MEDLDKQYPAESYAKKLFTFSKEELEELKPLQDVVGFVQTLFSLGQIAQKAQDNYVVVNVLKRLGVKQSPDTRTIYDVSKNSITVYEPKFFCSMCENKKAEYKYKDKPYCKDCIEVLKSKEVQPIEKSVDKSSKANKK